MTKRTPLEEIAKMFRNDEFRQSSNISSYDMSRNYERFIKGHNPDDESPDFLSTVNIIAQAEPNPEIRLHYYAKAAGACTRKDEESPVQKHMIARFTETFVQIPAEKRLDACDSILFDGKGSALASLAGKMAFTMIKANDAGQKAISSEDRTNCLARIMECTSNPEAADYLFETAEATTDINDKTETLDLIMRYSSNPETADQAATKLFGLLDQVDDEKKKFDLIVMISCSTQPDTKRAADLSSYWQSQMKLVTDPKVRLEFARQALVNYGKFPSILGDEAAEQIIQEVDSLPDPDDRPYPLYEVQRLWTGVQRIRALEKMVDCLDHDGIYGRGLADYAMTAACRVEPFSALQSRALEKFGVGIDGIQDQDDRLNILSNTRIEMENRVNAGKMQAGNPVFSKLAECEAKYLPRPPSPEEVLAGFVVNFGNRLTGSKPTLVEELRS